MGRQIGGMRHAFLSILAIFAVLSAGCGARSQDADGLLRAAHAALAREDLDAAEAAFAAALAAAPDDGRAWLGWAEFERFARQRGDLAAAGFARALALGDGQVRALAQRGLGDLAMHAGRADEAAARYRASLAERETAEAHRSLVHWAAVTGDAAAAARHGCRAAELAPDDPVARMLLAGALQRTGDADAAAAAFAQAIAMAGCDARGRAEGPIHCCVLLNGAGYHALRGDRAGALAMLAAFLATPTHRHITRSELLADPDFAGLRDDAAFRALADRAP